MRTLILLLALASVGCDIALTMPTPVAATPTAPGNVTVTNTTTVSVDRSDTEATPAPSGGSTPSPPTAGVLPLPSYGEGVAREYAALHADQVLHSCQLIDGEAAWHFLDGLIGVLQARDARWGYLCKDASCATKARDVVAYRASTGDTGIHLVDVLGSHCPGPGDSPTQFRWGVLPFETARRWSATR